jgi:hypothetical protein
MKNWSKGAFFSTLLAAMFLVGCATVSNELKNADEMLKSGNLRGALAELEKAYAKPVSSKEKASVGERIADVKRQITDSVLSDVAQILAPGSNIPSVKKALAVLEREISYDDAAGRLKDSLHNQSELLAKLQAEYQAAMNEASEAGTADSWSRAVLALRRAGSISPSDEIEQRLASLIARRDKTVPGLIERFVVSKNLEAAEKEFEKYSKEIPQPAGEALALLQNRIDLLRKEILEARLQGLVDGKKYYTAFQLINDSKRDYLDERLASVRHDGAPFYKAAAVREFAAGGSRLGYAFFAAEKAWQLQPDDVDIFRIRREISDVVNVAITHQISIDVFSAKEKEDGIALSNTLMEHLLANRPYGIQILERRQIDEILKEQGAKRAELESKVKMWIVGDVTTLNVERQKSEREGTVKVETGKRSIPNPEYPNYLKRYGKDRSKWPASLQSVRPENEELVTEMVKYKLGEEALSGIMVTSVRTFESSQGAVTAARVFKAAISTNGVFSDSVPLAHIEFVPLRMPTDNEIKESLRNDMATEIGTYVLSSFEHREQRFLESARASIVRQEFAQAVADLAGGYYYGHHDGRYIPDPEKHPVVSQIRQLGFFDYTE